MIGIIAAMDMELEELLLRMQNASFKTISGRKFVSGTIEGVPVVAVVCGIGKVNAALCAEAMILSYAPQAIINTGVGGALDKTLKISDVVVADWAVQYDCDTSALGDPVGFVSTVNTLRFETDEKLSRAIKRALENSGARAASGGIATGDRFVSRAEEKDAIVRGFGCVCCEMEGCAIAQVCRINAVPCAIIRAISDGADEDAGMSYQTFAAGAAKTSARALIRFLAENRDCL